MPCFLWNLCCGPTNTTIEINQLRSNLTNYNNNIITNFTKKLTYQYKLMKFKQKLFRTLRFLQFLGGFGITTMTTYNNPYFQDNIDTINIIVWYVSISNNIFNLLIEKLNAYDLTTEKMKIDLLIREGKLLHRNEKDYHFYEIDDTEEKLKYFEKCYLDILRNNPYNYLTSDIEHEDQEVNISRTRRYGRIWVTPVPTPPQNQD